jgi:outer membrane lipoprotein-sorting protein
MKPDNKMRTLFAQSTVNVPEQYNDRIINDAFAALGQSNRTTSAAKQPHMWRIIMKSKITKYAAAAVIVMAVLGGISFWPAGSSQWWLGPPKVWAQEIIESLDKVQAVIYRQWTFKVNDFGPDTAGSLWEKRYAAKSAYRRDLYDDANNIVNIQWTVPEGEGFVKYQVWPAHKCYTKEPEKYPPFYDNVMGWLRRWVSFMDRASRILGTRDFEGHQCIGFEVAPGKYDGFFVGEPFHIWFDVETRMPVRIERYGLKSEYSPSTTLTIIHDHFEYYAEVPADIFTPEIPQEFVNAHPDDIAAKKAGMIFADIPEELKDEIVSALSRIQTAVYREHLEVTVKGDLTVYPAHKIYLAPDRWREDTYRWAEETGKIEWYVIEEPEHQEVPLHLSDKSFRLIHTTIDLENRTYSVVTHADDSQHSHPLGWIRFRAGLVDRADRLLQAHEMHGIKGFGVEISANKWGSKNQETDKLRVWFDAETKLPVRIEFAYWQPDGRTKSVRVSDRFEWNPDLPADTFTPKIPEGFELVESTGG